MIVGFTGTQMGTTPEQNVALGDLLYQLMPSALRHGDCVGADAEAHRVAKDKNVDVIIHPPDNPKKRAWCDSDNIWLVKPYLERNKTIVDMSDILIACPAEQTGEKLRSGTWSTVRYARKKHKPIVIIRPDGTLEREWS